MRERPSLGKSHWGETGPRGGVGEGVGPGQGEEEDVCVRARFVFYVLYYLRASHSQNEKKIKRGKLKMYIHL